MDTLGVILGATNIGLGFANLGASFSKEGLMRYFNLFVAGFCLSSGIVVIIRAMG